MKSVKLCRAVERLLKKMPVNVVQIKEGVQVRPLAKQYEHNGETFNDSRTVHWSDKQCIEPLFKHMLRYWDFEVYSNHIRDIVKLCPCVSKQMDKKKKDKGDK